jgi:methylmalonyl-CoA mutase C-terminal domain/subunit
VSVTDKIRVLVAKPGLDGHDRGAKVIARGLRDAGFEVVYLGLRLTPEQIAEAAVQEDVDVVGLSCLSGAHMALFPETVRRIREKGGGEVLIVGGGIIPNKDVDDLRRTGLAQVFGPGTPIKDIVTFLTTALEGKNR